MRWTLLGAAALLSCASFATPADAQLAGAPGASVGSAGPGLGSTAGRDGRDDRRRDRRRGDVVVLGGYGYGGEWALYNNRTFEPDSYNDWWHERTERSYPRWMQNNQGCERRWWGGGAWRC
uniref:hypothetical protein n=1 Tax=uncultured Sphingomonas sp. TaxID=158754 RepID=UPI0025F4B1C6|nr:hypothetical protein [uncultured Sphingomonas sp.]